MTDINQHIVRGATVPGTNPGSFAPHDRRAPAIEVTAPKIPFLKLVDPRYQAGVSDADDDMSDEEWVAGYGPAPSVAEQLGYSPECVECGDEATFRLGNIPNGYRSPESEAVFCDAHAAQEAASGRVIDAFPSRQEPGELVQWLVEGDDHEYEMVEATTEKSALDLAADRFHERYGDEDEDEEGDSDDSYFDLRSNLVVAGVFRGEEGGYSDEFEFVPYQDIRENDAYGKLQHI